MIDIPYKSITTQRRSSIMIKIENTVSAVNQMINSSELSFIGNENAPLKICAKAKGTLL